MGTHLIIALLVLLPGVQRAQQHVVRNPELRAELIAMLAEDQRVRSQPPEKFDEALMASEDSRHTARLRQMVAQHGWPTLSDVGPDGAMAAFLIALHADRNPDFQKEALANMARLAEMGEAERSNVAYLWDRTHTPQRYGTQGNCTGKAKWTPRKIEDSEGVDARRAEVGLPPMIEYQRVVAEFCTRDESMPVSD